MLSEQIIKVFYDDKGYPFKDQSRTVRFPIVGQAFLGASNTTKIRFYYELLGDNNTTWVSVAKLPNGLPGSCVLSKSSDDNGRYAELQLNDFYTQAKGDVFIALQGFQGGVDYTYDEETGIYSVVGTPTIQTTGSIKLSINYAPLGSAPNKEDEFTDYQQILALMGTKLDVDSSIVVIDTITSVDTSIYEDGQLFYIKDRHHLYKFVSGNFVVYKDYLVIDENELSDNSMLLTQEQKNILLANDDFLVVYFDGGNDFLMYEKREESNSELVYNAYSISHNESTRVIEIKDNELHIYKSDYEVEMFNYSYNTYDTYKLDNTIEVALETGTITKAQWDKLNKFPSFIVAGTGSSQQIYVHYQSNLSSHPKVMYFKCLNRTQISNGTGYKYFNENYAYVSYESGDTGTITFTSTSTKFYDKDQTDTLLSAKADITYVDNAISNAISTVYKYKGSVATYADLPSSDLSVGDVYNVESTGDNYAWTGSAWDKLAGNVDLSNYYTKSETDTFLSGKQDTLVSATNIKTINGNSILGSGDLVISSTTPDFATNSEIDALFE